MHSCKQTKDDYFWMHLILLEQSSSFLIPVVLSTLLELAEEF